MSNDYLKGIKFDNDTLSVNEKDFLVKKVKNLEKYMKNIGIEEKSIDLDGENISANFLIRINELFKKINE